MAASIADNLIELAKRRGFFFQSCGAYGGVSGFYTFGPHGATVKRNVEERWRDRFAIQEGHQEVDAPTVMPEPVFEASGHLEGFDDMLIECPECTTSHRADHLIEDHPDSDVEDAEALPIDDVENLFADFGIVCPECGTALADEPVEDFNLMFGTNIGPGSSAPGYLRPETAQGIFVEFPRLKQYARGQLPFGVTQVGRAYRNEISPRKSIIRVREFTQAELELFIDPEEDQPDLSGIEDTPLSLYPVTEQNADDGEVIDTTVSGAIEEGIIESPWIAYYLGIAREWYESIGVDMDRFRYRQHLPGERAHYAADCWDAEAFVADDWVELSGFADRGDYDLRKHGEYSDEEFTLFKRYDEPKEFERATVDPDMSELGPKYGDAAADIAAALEDAAEHNPETLAQATDTVTVETAEDRHEVPMDLVNYSEETVVEDGEHITPAVIEPSFGVDRIVYTVLEHAYTEDDVDGEERAYLELDPAVAPTTVGVFPQMDREGMDEKAQSIADDLREAGLAVAYDDSGSIGRRYRRQDEIGTPYCVTVDHQTIEDGTVTIRDRDTTDQVRVPIEELSATIADLTAGRVAFQDLD